MNTQYPTRDLTPIAIGVISWAIANNLTHVFPSSPITHYLSLLFTIHYSKFDIGYSLILVPASYHTNHLNLNLSFPDSARFSKPWQVSSTQSLNHFCSTVFAPCFPCLSTPTSVGPTQAVGRAIPSFQHPAPRNQYPEPKIPSTLTSHL